MRFVFLIVIVLVVANICLHFVRSPKTPNGETWVVTRIVSGQAVDAIPFGQNSEKPIRARLIGISAPYKEQTPWGDRARGRLEELVKDQKVVFEYDEDRLDRGDRPLVYIWQDHKLINAQLVKEGYVMADSLPPNLKYASEMERVQSEARLLELGIWEPQNPMSLSPKEYRRRFLR